MYSVKWNISSVTKSIVGGKFLKKLRVVLRRWGRVIRLFGFVNSVDNLSIQLIKPNYLENSLRWPIYMM